MAKQKLISGATDEDLNRVLVNIQQISASSNNFTKDLREMQHALPTLRTVFQDTFSTVDSGKLRSIFEQNPDKFFDKFAAGMAKTKTAQGGLNSGITDFQNQWTILSRETGQQFLPQLEKNLTEVTKDLVDNKQMFKDWGEGINAVLKGVSDVSGSRIFTLISYLKEATERGSLLIATMGFSGGANVKGFAEGIKNRGRDLQDLTLLAQGNGLGFVDYQNRFDKQNQTVGSIVTNNLSTLKNIGLSPEEINAKRLNDERKTELAIERTREQLLEYTKDLRARELANGDIFYKVQEARLNSHLNYTLEDQLKNTRQIADVRKSSLKNQRAIENAYYADTIKNGNLSGSELQKFEIEHKQSVFKTNGEIYQNEYATQRQILEMEKQIQDQRRQALIQFNQLKIRGSDNIFGG